MGNVSRLIEQESRSFRKFRSSISNESTWIAYSESLEKFCLYSGLTHEQIMAMDTEELQTVLEDWAMSMSEKGRKKTGVLRTLAGVEKFLDINRKLYYKKALHGLVKDNNSDRRGGQIPFETFEIKAMLEATTKLRSKALVHFFKSSGGRPGVLVDPVLRLKHMSIQFDQNGKDTGCLAIRCYDNSQSGFDENSVHGYWIFMDPEARKAIERYHGSRRMNGEIMTPDSPIFEANGHKNDFLSIKAAYQILSDLFKMAGIKRELVGDRYDKAVTYGFRKRFNTILKLGESVNSNIAEKLMAHKKGLDGRYLRPSRDQCFSEFRKAIKELMIDDSERTKVTINNLETEKDKALEESNNVKHQFSHRIRQQSKRIADLEDKLEKLLKK